MEINNKQNNKIAGGLGEQGFSLIEMIIAMSIFVVVVSVAAMVFSSNSSYQKRIFYSQDVENNARYITELLARELRTAKEMNNSEESVSLEDAELNFKNYRNENIIYCASDSFGACDSSGEFIARISPAGAQTINTSTVRIRNFKFITDEFSGLPSRQKMITIFFTAESLYNPSLKLDIQTSIAMRLY